jgi:hypothetical protein
MNPKGIFKDFITKQKYGSCFPSSRWKDEGGGDNEGIEVKQGPVGSHSDEVTTTMIYTPW